jgi:8-oxo-dGTP pyrophosphatase MutT (NUDIX family)
VSASADLPSWLVRLVDAAATTGAERMSRFLIPDEETVRQSAVLMAFADGVDGASVLLIQRAATLRKHAGQVAFPGGSVDADDPDAIAAALREAEEEVGLDPATVEVLTTFPALYIPVSEFAVTPVLAWWRDPHEVAPGDPAEVARVELVPIAELVDPANRFTVTHPSGFVGPGFQASGLFIWGFTANVLSTLLDLAGWARPWDISVRRPLPPDLIGRPVPPAAADPADQ